MLQTFSTLWWEVADEVISSVNWFTQTCLIALVISFTTHISLKHVSHTYIHTYGISLNFTSFVSFSAN